MAQSANALPGMSGETSTASPAETYALLVREVPRLRRYARFLTENVDMADRLVQECLSKSIMTIDSKPRETTMRAWLFVIMHGVHRERAKSHSQVSNDTADQRDLQIAFDRLDDEHQKIMLMIEMDGLEHADTAAALGVSVDTIHERLLRARAALRTLMEAALPNEV